MHIFHKIVLSGLKKHRHPEVQGLCFALCPALTRRQATELIRLMNGADALGIYTEQPSKFLKRSWKALLIWSAFRVLREKPALFFLGMICLIPGCAFALIHVARRLMQLFGLGH